MLRGHDLIYFGVGPWDDLMRPRQQLMSVFAKQNRVLYVEGRRYLRTTLTDLRRGNLKLSELRRPTIRRISENLFIFHYPIWAPISRRFPLHQITKTVRRIYFRNTLRKLSIRQPIVWFLRPSMVDLINDIPEARLLLYHMEDEYTAYRGHTPTSRHRTEKLEREMMARADIVIVVSKNLYEAKHRFNPNTYLVPNGVNYQAYAAALADPHLPSDLQAIKPPRLGYSGLISDKLDFNMLKELAQENPEWSLVFLGKVRVFAQVEAWQTLRAMPNVHQLGPVQWSQVPHYVKGFQVGLMPYVQDRHAEYISPMKLYDYLAAGLPIVSVDIPAAREFRQHIHLFTSARDFARAVRAALADTAPERRQARRNLAAPHSWEARAEQISALIQAQLAAKSTHSSKRA